MTIFNRSRRTPFLALGKKVLFFTFTSAEVLAAASSLHDPDLDHWMAWYRDLYSV